MQDGEPSIRVAIFNDSRSILTLLHSWFEGHGYPTITGVLPERRDPLYDLPRIVRDFRADVIVFDVGIPLLATWEFLAAYRLVAPITDLPMVVTTRNLAALNAVIGESTGAYEFTGTAENLVKLLLLVEQAAAARREAR
jgi:DNA-binding NtrC family response regulator